MVDDIKRKLVVKCRRCGAVCTGKTNYSDEFVHNEAIGHRTTIHRCDYGGIGIADMIGFETDEDKMKRECMEVLNENNPNII